MKAGAGAKMRAGGSMRVRGYAPTLYTNDCFDKIYTFATPM